MLGILLGIIIWRYNMPVQKRHKTKYPGVYYIVGKAIGKSSKERIYYVMYRKDGKQIHEKAGRQYQDDMTATRAAQIRARRIEGRELSNKKRRKGFSYDFWLRALPNYNF